MVFNSHQRCGQITKILTLGMMHYFTNIRILFFVFFDNLLYLLRCTGTVLRWSFIFDLKYWPTTLLQVEMLHFLLYSMKGFGSLRVTTKKLHKVCDNLHEASTYVTQQTLSSYFKEQCNAWCGWNPWLLTFLVLVFFLNFWKTYILSWFFCSFLSMGEGM